MRTTTPAWFGATMKIRRQALGLSREEFGKLAGFSRVMVWRFEVNKVIPNAAQRAVIATHLYCTVADLSRKAEIK